MYILLKGDPETEEIGVDKDNISETMYFGDTEDLSDCDKEQPGSKAYTFSSVLPAVSFDHFTQCLLFFR